MSTKLTKAELTEKNADLKDRLETVLRFKNRITDELAALKESDSAKFNQLNQLINQAAYREDDLKEKNEELLRTIAAVGKQCADSNNLLMRIKGVIESVCVNDGDLPMVIGEIIRNT